MNENRVDTRTTTRYTIGHDMATGAGYSPADYEAEGWCNEDIARQIADFHAEEGNVWVDFDGRALPVYTYALEYLERQ